ncbi:putative delta-60 repeat protein/predicted secreted protein (Por secretion system target) [Flavobacterium aquaticum]|uniref:Putative delta-60 repeat protein/predicted secreted protein (Por secretion system target) n=1 Tax=Flavobacterium aquaticum TaxID=1236486 RepID=A0A327Z0K7_9FLAO|nr:T9SS type A sorting domain-containing protein [Flavobacterium aquaticum]RAK23759.1 putative delta-60 repeat protein/predicted secreted protein (Por secretion system target) [Flavobacterium aquaticum]
MRKHIQLLLIIFSLTSFAQDGTIDSSFNIPTGAINGVVNTIVTQNDGKMIVGGDFTFLNRLAFNKLGRLNTDGTNDLSFSIGSGFDNTVNFVQIQPDGKLIVVGNFTQYNGVTKNRIVRLNTNGTIDPTFNIGSGFNSVVYSTKIQSDGKIIVVGNFTQYNGITRNRIVRLNIDGTIDSSFNIGSGANNMVNTCDLQPDGKIIVAGNFTSYNGVSYRRIIRLNNDGTLDTTFNTSTSASSTIKTVCVQSDGKLIIGGEFSTYKGVTVNRIVRLNSDSTIDTTFNSGTGFFNFVNTIVSQTDGKILVGGYFTSYNDIYKNRILRLNNDGSLDSSFNSNASIVNSTSSTPSFVQTISIQSNGKIIFGGNFDYASSNTYRNNIASINVDGSIDNSFFPFIENSLSSNNSIRAIGLQSDGKIIIGGFFASYNGVSANRIARLNTDGTLDTTFNIGTGANGAIQDLKVLSNDKIVIVGDFTTFNGITKNKVAMLHSDGTLDTFFNASVSPSAETVSEQSNGKILIGGGILTVNGQPRAKLASLNLDGSLDTSFLYGPYLINAGAIRDILVQPDGKIYISHDQKVIRLNSNGTLDTTFNSTGGGGNGHIGINISRQSDGKIILVGNFKSFNGVPSYGIVRLNTDGSNDSSFYFDSPLLSAQSRFLLKSVIQNDGKIIFVGYDSMSSVSVKRVNSDGSLDNTFSANDSLLFNVSAENLVIQNDGKIIVCGGFTHYSLNSGNSIEKRYILRLNNNSGTLSTTDFDNNIELNLYPNPVKDNLNFNLPIGVNVLSFEVFDLIGKKIDSNTLQTNFINVKHYVNGIYILHLKTDKGVLIKKFIKN